MEVRMEGFDVNQMTKRKPAIWGPPKLLLTGRALLLTFWKVYAAESAKQRALLSITYHG